MYHFSTICVIALKLIGFLTKTKEIDLFSSIQYFFLTSCGIPHQWIPLEIGHISTPISIGQWTSEPSCIRFFLNPILFLTKTQTGQYFHMVYLKWIFKGYKLPNFRFLLTSQSNKTNLDGSIFESLFGCLFGWLYVCRVQGCSSQQNFPRTLQGDVTCIYFF